MRRVLLNRDDFEMFHQDISPMDYEFFRTHVETFKRMWKEQTRQFWSLFLGTFEHFIWKHGCIKDFPMRSREVYRYIDEILDYIKEQFVNGKVSTAKKLVYDCVIVTQNRHCITILDKATYAQNPFYMKETREVFRELFGAPNDKRTYLKVLCGLPMYVKFAGSAVVALRRWMDAPEIDPEDETAKKNYFDNIFVRHHAIDDRMQEKFRQIAALAYEHMKEEAAAELVSESDQKKKKKKKKKKSKSTDKSQEPEERGGNTASDQTVKTNASSDSSKTEMSKLLKSEDGASTPSDLLQTKTDDTKEGSAELNPNRPTGSGTVKEPCSSEDATVASAEDKTTKRVEKKEVIAMETKNNSKCVPSERDTVKKVTTNEREKTDDRCVDSGGTQGSEQESKVQAKREEKSAESASGDVAGCSDNAQDSLSCIKKRGADSVAKEEKEAVPGDSGARKKLHTCGLCGREEINAKTFKRCQKCRGKSTPKFYCSRECQVRDWKTHKLDHKDDP